MSIYTLNLQDGSQVKVEAPKDTPLSELIALARQKERDDDKPEVDPADLITSPIGDTALGRGINRGIDTLQQNFGSAVEGLGSVLGLEGVEEFGAKVALDNEAQGQRRARYATRLDDVEGISSGASYIGELAGESAPQMAQVATGAGIGAAIGAPFGGPIGATIGAAIGGLAAGIPLFFGSNRERQKEAIDKGIKTEINEGAAFLTAIPQAALDSILTVLGAKFFLKPAAVVGGGLLTRAAKGAGAGAVTEIPTEIGQAVLERAQAGLPLADAEAMREYGEAGLAAGLLGGGIGGVSGAAKRPSSVDADADPQGELFLGEDLGQAPESPVSELSAPEQGELFPDADLGPTPADERQGDLFRKDKNKKDDTPTGLASLRGMRDMVTESQDQIADEKAREREGLRAAGRKDEATFEQPDLFAQELERERRRLGPEELRNPEQYMDDLEAVTGKTDAGKVKPVSRGQAQINRLKERKASLAMGEPFQRDLVDLIDEDKAREDSANVRKATEKAAAKERAIEADTELGLRDMQGKVDPKARRLENQGRPEQLSFLGDLQRYMLPKRLGEVDGQATKTDPNAGRGGFPPSGEDVGGAGNNNSAGDADTKKGAGGIEPSTDGGLGSPSVVFGLPDGAEGAKPTALGRNALGGGRTPAGAKFKPIPAGIKGVAKKAAPKDTEGAQVARLYDEETPDAVKKIFGASKTSNPFSEPDNKKIKDKILQGATKSDKSKKEDVPVVAYLRAFSNPFDGIEMALFDKVNGTPIAKQAGTYKDKAGNLVKDTDVASKADVEARRGMGGVASKKGELSSADRTIAWARANLSKEANVKINKRLQQLKDNQINTTVFEGGPDRVVAAQAAGLLNVRKNLESLVLSNYTDPMELVKAYPDVYPSKAAVEKAMFDDPSFGINVQVNTLSLNLGAVVGLDLPIDPAVEAAVNEGDLGAVLSTIADTNPVKQIRQLAKTFEDVLTNRNPDRLKAAKEATKKSKVKNIVYHGSSKKDITEFKATKSFSKGLYFSPRRQYANLYRKDRGAVDAGRLYEVMLDIRNPLVIKGTVYGSLMDRIDVALGRKTRKEVRKETRLKRDSSTLSEERIAELKSQGYDGIMNEDASEYVAFDSSQIHMVSGDSGQTQIKSVEGLKLNGRPVPGLFDPKTNTISLDKTTGINTHTIMHETTHALASAETANPKSSAGIQLNKLFNDVKEYLGTAYGAQDVQEFLAESQSNPEFRADLASINIKGENVTALQKLFNIVQNMLSRYVPFIQSRNITLIQEVDSLVDALLAPAPKYRNANQMGMSSTVDGVKDFAKNVIGKTQQSVNKGSRKQWGYDAADFMRNAGSQGKGLLMKLTAMQGLGDIAESVGLGKLGYTLDDLLSRQRGGIQTANKVLQGKVENILKTLNQSSPEKTRKVTAALDDVIYNTEYGATIFQVDPSKDRLEYINKDNGRSIIDPDGNVKTEIWDKQRASWNAMGKDGQQAYKDMQSVYRTSYEKLKDVIFGQIDNLVGNKEASTKLKKDIFTRLFKQSTLDVYFPLMREGDYVLRFDAKNPKSEREKTTLITFTTKTERNLAEKFYRDTGDYTNFDPIDTGVTASMFRSGGADLGFATETLNILDKAQTKDGDAIPDEVKDQIMRLFVNSLPETSFAKSLQKRKGTPGYMQDSVYALKEKGASLASQTAKLEYAAKLRMYEQELRDAKPLAIKQAKSLVGKGTKKLSSSFDEVRVELLKRAEFGRQGAKNQTVEGIARRLNQMAFMYTIGFNTSSALVNLSQIPLFVAPYLGGEYGYAETTKAISNAYGNVNFGGKRGGKTNSILNYYDISDDGTFTLKKGLDLPAGKEAELKRMTLLVKTASERGLLGQGYLAEAMGLNEASPAKKGNLAGRIVDNASVLSAWLFNHGEQLNRQVTLMASFNLALDAQTGTKNIEKAVQDAIYNTQKTNGGTFLETAPSLLNTGVGRVAGMYKSYGLQMYYVMFQTAKIAFDSDKGKLFGSDKGSIERKTAWKQLIGMHGSALFFAGIQGLPLYGAVRLMVNLFVLDDEEEDFDTIVRRYVGEGWYKGAVNQMTGMDVASRMALTGLLIQENRYNNDPSLEEEIGFYLGGPALSVANRLVRGGTDLFNGEIERGIESIIPAGLANALRASPFGRYQTEGVKTRRGDFIYDDITGGELAALFFGIQPTELTFRQEQNNITKSIDIAVGKRRSKLAKKLYMAKRMGDYFEQVKIKEEMRKFSADHPEAKIDSEYLKRSLKKHRETSKLMAKYNGITLSPTYRKTLEEFREGYDK